MPYGNHVRARKTSMSGRSSNRDDLVKRSGTDFIFENAESFVERFDENIGQLVGVVVLKEKRDRLIGGLAADGSGLVRHVIVPNLEPESFRMRRR